MSRHTPTVSEATKQLPEAIGLLSVQILRKNEAEIELKANDHLLTNLSKRVLEINRRFAECFGSTAGYGIYEQIDTCAAEESTQEEIASTSSAG